MKSKSSTSSAASEGSASDSNEPDLFGQSPSASKTPSVKPSCESTGPTQRSTTTLEPSTQMDIEELTSSAAVSRANPSPLPGSGEAQTMTAISGRKCCELLKLYKVGGSLAKMSEALLTSRWASSAAFLTWKASDTKPSHLLFQLAPSAPRTDETGFGLWPTPTGQDNIQVRGGGKTAGTKRGTTLGGAVRMWPTPRAAEWKGTGPLGSKSHKHRLAKSYLDATVQEAEQVTGQLNPTWVEWLMGYEIGHTDLKPSEMPSSRRSSRKSAKQSSRQNHDPA